MQPNTKHSHTRVGLHLGSHTFGSLLRLRKAVGVSKKKTGLLFASMVLAALFVGALPTTASQLTKVEAEQATVGTWGAVVNDTTASGGRALRWKQSATTGTVNFTISESADSVTVFIKAGSNSASQVCVRPIVDNVALGTQPLCVGATQRTYVGRTFTANVAAGTHTLALSGSEHQRHRPAIRRLRQLRHQRPPPTAATGRPLRQPHLHLPDVYAGVDSCGQ